MNKPPTPPDPTPYSSRIDTLLALHGPPETGGIQITIQPSITPDTAIGRGTGPGFGGGPPPGAAAAAVIEREAIRRKKQRRRRR